MRLLKKCFMFLIVFYFVQSCTPVEMDVDNSPQSDEIIDTGGDDTGDPDDDKDG